MNILCVSPWAPWPKDRGCRQRLHHFLRALVARHRVTLVSFEDPRGLSGGRDPLADEFHRIIGIDHQARPLAQAERYHRWAPLHRRLGALVSSPIPSTYRMAHCDRFVEVLRELRESDDFDLVWAVRPSSGEMARAAGFRRIIVDVDDLESVKFEQSLRLAPWYYSKPLHYVELAKLSAYERLLPYRYERAVVCKELDREFFGKNAGKVLVLPNGVEDHPTVDPDLEQDGSLLFVGSLDYEPNADAVSFLVHDILPRLRRLALASHPRLTIVGREPGPVVSALDNGDDCVVRANVPDVRPYYEKAAVVLAPLRWGGGTRLKILEALGMGKAVVATSLAAEGIDLHPGVDLEVADDPEDFARACAGLLSDPAARRRLGSSGRARVRDSYSWSSIGETLNRILMDVASGDSGGRRVDPRREAIDRRPSPRGAARE